MVVTRHRTRESITPFDCEPYNGIRNANGPDLVLSITAIIKRSIIEGIEKLA